jgi:beta-1,2-mannobiose phosphorylase / 1,2-beta-oligomannan phosphorylase
MLRYLEFGEKTAMFAAFRGLAVQVRPASGRASRSTFPAARRWGRIVAVAATLLAIGWGVGTSSADDKFPPELVSFVPYERNPIFTAQGEGHWDVKIRERGWILREGDLYRMWYTGYDGTREGLKMLGYATSRDGLQWTPHPQNPIYKDHWVEDMMVVKQGDTYYMFAEGRDDQAHLLTSPDGIHWHRRGRLDIRHTDGTPIQPGPYGTPTAFFEEGTWYLFYERRDLGIWLATSKDMKVWTHAQDDPVLSPGPDEYDRDLIALNQIVKYDGRYYAGYHGSAKGRSPSLWSTNVAVSTDLVNWKKFPGNPLFPLEANKSSGVWVHDGKQFRLYTMHDEVHVHFPRAASGR